MPDPTVNLDAPRQIPVARPSLGEAEAEAARAAVAEGWISSGPRVEDFERQFAAAHGRRHGVACNSGTTALHLALAALGVAPGDQVLVPSLTMIAVANAVLYCGARPVLVDSERESGNPDALWLPRVITPRTKAAIVPHLYGVPAAAFLQALRRRYPRLSVIEDCAEAHYATLAGRPVGSLGRLATFSFYANKIITTGEGGMVLTDDERLAERLRSLRAHAFTPGDHFRHQSLAFGYRMTDVQAAIGLVQHGRREELLRRRAELAQRYIDRLRELKWVGFPARVAGAVWWVFPLLCPHEAARDAVRQALAERGIETRSYFRPLHRQTHLRRFATQHYPVADELSRRGFYLPLWPGMSDEDVEYVCKPMWEALNRF